VQQLEQTPVKLVRQVGINQKKELQVAYIASLGNTSRKKSKQVALNVLSVEHLQHWPTKRCVQNAPQDVTKQNLAVLLV
jgi:hypothetical protein